MNYVNHTAPPLPDRNYDAEEVQQNYNPRYTPSPGTLDISGSKEGDTTHIDNECLPFLLKDDKI